MKTRQIKENRGHIDVYATGEKAHDYLEHLLIYARAQAKEFGVINTSLNLSGWTDLETEKVEEKRDKK